MVGSREAGALPAAAAQTHGIIWIQVKFLGGRLSESGARLAHVCDGGNATRSVVRGNGSCAALSGKPAAQQAAQA
jgi:hypothetical protein